MPLPISEGGEFLFLRLVLAQRCLVQFRTMIFLLWLNIYNVQDPIKSIRGMIEINSYKVITYMVLYNIDLKIASFW